jgi:hypothetical protein
VPPMKSCRETKCKEVRKNYVHYFTTGTSGYFCLNCTILRCLTFFVETWQDHLASLQAILLRSCICESGSRSATLHLSPDLGAGHSDSAALAAIYSNSAYSISNYIQLSSLPADSVGPGPGHPAAPVLAIAS